MSTLRFSVVMVWVTTSALIVLSSLQLADAADEPGGTLPGGPGGTLPGGPGGTLPGGPGQAPIPSPPVVEPGEFSEPKISPRFFDFELSSSTPQSIRETIAHLEQRLKVAENAEMLGRKSCSHSNSVDVQLCQSVETVLEEVVKSISAFKHPSAPIRMEFAEASVAWLLPSGHQDVATGLLHQEILRLSKPNQVPTHFTAIEQHEWLSVVAKFKRVRVAQQAVYSASLLLQGGRTDADLIMDADTRLFAAKSDFAVAAFGRIAPHTAIPEITMKRAVSVVRLKQIEQAWANALLAWAIIHERVTAGVESSHHEWGLREMVYYYESLWHEAKASDLELWTSPTATVTEGPSSRRRFPIRVRRRS